MYGHIYIHPFIKLIFTLCQQTNNELVNVLLAIDKSYTAPLMALNCGPGLGVYWLLGVTSHG